MNYFIKVGGIAVIAAIAGIFIFILSQILPLFRAPSVEYARSIPLPDIAVEPVAIDEWSELPMFVDRQGKISFLDLSEREESESRGMFSLTPEFSESELDFTFVRYNQDRSELLLGTNDGRFTAVRVSYEATHPSGGRRLVVPSLTPTPITQIGVAGEPFELFDYVDAGRIKLAVAVQREEGEAKVNAMVLRQRQTLLGPGPLEVDKSFDLTDLFPGEPINIQLTGEGDFLIVSTAEGLLHLLARHDNGFNLRQSLAPFEDLSNQEIHSINFLSGNVSLVLTNGDGAARMFSIYHDSGAGERILGKTKDFEPLPAGATFFSPSLRNKGFLFGTEDFASLRFATTAQTRWESQLDYRVKQVVLGGRYDKILMLDDQNTLHLYDLRDRHPQAGWAAYFGKIHYEGRAHAEYVWQSTGGSDAFEPKISMVPLIIGTVKGTIYAMLFAIPIALLCAIYTSQFLPSRLRRTVKPAMEIMESVPTVVLGFLAALWLAPILSERVPSFILICIGVPIAALVMGWVVASLPQRLKVLVKPGYEFLYFTPVLFLVSWLCWELGPVLEQLVFISTDPNSGVKTADFRLWLTNEMGIPFEQRNALVVGFLMGFAVIPTIFTIAEDSMTNVPTAFKSASLALGASRWQTTMNIVIPTAAAGIFSALMIGFGRAVGETMIVLMATGNTPVMTLNIFEGMRTLSANIAVELPEASHGGTLYRSLFLGAMLLFLMTFIVNTLAEILRQHLREKYKAVE